MTRIHLKAIVTCTVAGLGLMACKSETKNEGAAADSAATAPAPAAVASPTLSDPQIAMIAVVANSLDSAGGEMAKKKGKSADVKSFAQTMVTDHSAVNKEATALAGKLNVTPEESDASRQLRQSQDQVHGDLDKKSGADFDKSYIDNEVGYHQAVLDAIDNQLIPNAQNAELKGLLEKVRPAVAAHLDHAKQIQAKLAPTAQTGQ